MVYQQILTKSGNIKSAFKIQNSLNKYYSISAINSKSLNAIFHDKQNNGIRTNLNYANDLSSKIIHLPQVAHFHLNTTFYKDPESNAEKAVNLIKENIIAAKKEEAAKQESAAPLSAAAEKLSESVKKESSESVKPLVQPQNPAFAPPVTTTATQEAVAQSSDEQKQVDVARPTLWQRIVKELKHYYDGFKLLGYETKIAWGLMKKVLNGHTLTRRERRQFTRTAADLFRLVPFSVFIIVPFMEFTLPIFLKLFPNMLPSTFTEQSKEQENLKKKLKAKLEMAKFLQDTLEETSLKSNGEVGNEATLKFGEFMKKIRTKGEQPTNDDIMRYSSLFENELTLDNLTRQQLIALCQILDVSTLANIPPNHILRFQLRMKIRNLEADDKMILKEGVETLTTDELQQACRDRGMRAIGVSEARLRKQLEQWLDLHINRNIPLSLLILSRALYLPENLPAEDLIKTTIAALPKTIENATMAKIAEVTGAEVDNKTKLELLKQEEVAIKLENAAVNKEAAADATTAAAAAAAAKESPVPAKKPDVVKEPVVEKVFAQADQLAKEKLVDKAKVVGAAEAQAHEELTPVDIKEINQIIENLPAAETKQVKAEIEELKKDITEYKEDVKEVEQLTKTPEAPTAKLTETKSAKLLSKRVQKLLTDMDKLMTKIEAEKTTETKKEPTKNAVSIDELMATIKKLRGVSNDVKEQKLMEVLKTLDQDKDGKIDDLNDVLKVFDLIEQENVKVTKDQLGKILNLLEKEKLIEMEETKASQATAAETKEASAANTKNNKQN